MGRDFLTIAITTMAALALSGCGLADSHAIWPDFMKTKTVEPALEAPPDAVLLVRGHLDAVFTTGSNPQEVQVSPARHDPRGTGWTACVRAQLTSATGKPLGQQTYRVNINDGVILDRQRVDGDDTCFSETFAPI